ncbi:hypothetical protein Hypma_001500 [Hypsizygus marmoreus]|uniref:Uncharacterized protein n=1 Tax=Hypsizygus marmoreus TaxID=39966 RepID=A0A369K445_HYPMA|nr:hypothetical protein Hypma_001500 [Hypsizygus marmoreus]
MSQTNISPTSAYGSATKALASIFLDFRCHNFTPHAPYDKPDYSQYDEERRDYGNKWCEGRGSGVHLFQSPLQSRTDEAKAIR